MEIITPPAVLSSTAHHSPWFRYALNRKAVTERGSGILQDTVKLIDMKYWMGPEMAEKHDD